MPSALSRRAVLVSAGILLTGAALAGCSAGTSSLPVTSTYGTLIVTVAAVKGGHVGQVEVTGPRGFTRTLAATTRLSALQPGTYQVSARPAHVAGAAWWSALPLQEALVSAGRTTRIDDTYTVEVPATTRTIPTAALRHQAPLVHPTQTEIVVLDAHASAGLRVGDIIATGIGPYTPYGLLRRVVSITRHGASVLVDTVQATLREALPSGSIDIELGSAAPSSGSSTALKVNGDDIPVELASSNTPQLQGLWSFNSHVACGSVGQLSLDDGFSFHPVVKLNDYWSPFSGVSGTFAVGFDESAHLMLDTRFGVTCRWSDSSAPVPLSGPIDVQVGPIPVVVLPEWFISTSVSGTLSQDAVVGLSQASSALLGLSYYRGTVLPIRQFHNRFSPAKPQGTQLSVTAAIGPRFELSIYGVAGPYLSIQLFGKGTITEASSGQGGPTASIIAGVEAGVGFKLNVLPINWSIPNLLNIYRTIYSGPAGKPSTGSRSSQGAAGALAAYLKSGPHPSVASEPATTSAGTFALVLYPNSACLSCKLAATVLRYQAEKWHPVAQLELPLQNGDDVEPNSATPVDATGAATPDFLAGWQTGVNFGLVGVIVSDVTGRWAVVQIAPHQPGIYSGSTLDAPVIQRGRVISLLFSCNPNCVAAQQHRLVWHYEIARGGLVLLSDKPCGRVGQVSCP